MLGGHLLPALLRSQEVRAAGELVIIGARRRLLVVLIVGLDHVRRHQVVDCATDQQQRRAVVVLELTRVA